MLHIDKTISFENATCIVRKIYICMCFPPFFIILKGRRKWKRTKIIFSQINLDRSPYSSATLAFSSRKRGKWKQQRGGGARGNRGRQEESKELAAPAQMQCGRWASKWELEPLSLFLASVNTTSILLCVSFHPPFKSCLWIETSKNNIIPKGSLFTHICVWNRRTL